MRQKDTDGMANSPGHNQTATAPFEQFDHGLHCLFKSFYPSM